MLLIRRTFGYSGLLFNFYARQWVLL